MSDKHRYDATFKDLHSRLKLIRTNLKMENQNAEEIRLLTRTVGEILDVLDDVLRNQEKHHD